MQPLRTNQCPCSRRVHQATSLWNWTSELARVSQFRVAQRARAPTACRSTTLLKVDHGHRCRWKRWCRRSPKRRCLTPLHVVSENTRSWKPAKITGARAERRSIVGLVACSEAFVVVTSRIEGDCTLENFLSLNKSIRALPLRRAFQTFFLGRSNAQHGHHHTPKINARLVVWMLCIRSP